MEMINYFSFNSIVIILYFVIALTVFVLNYVFQNKLNTLLFSSYRCSIFNPLGYIRLFTHIFGHASWEHFMNNFLYILLIGPMIEEKYGSQNLLFMILVTSGIIGLVNNIFTKKRILGASGIVFMLIILSSFVNIELGKIPVTLILICLFYIVNEVISGLFKKDNVSHLAHLIGALCGFVFGYFIF